MTDFPRESIAQLFVHSVGRYGAMESLAGLGATYQSETWPTANKAIYIPFVLPWHYVVRRVFWINGSSVTSTNMDFGIYNIDGTRLYSTGSTAASGASVAQYVTPTAFLLNPGTYYMALAGSSVTANRGGTGTIVTTAPRMRLGGCLEEASALPLPAAMTPVACTFTFLPICGITRTASGF